MKTFIVTYRPKAPHNSRLYVYTCYSGFYTPWYNNSLQEILRELFYDLKYEHHLQEST